MFHLRLNGRLWGGGGNTASSAMTESLTSVEVGRLRFEWGGRCGIGCADGLEGIAYATGYSMKWAWRDWCMLSERVESLGGVFGEVRNQAREEDLH